MQHNLVPLFSEQAAGHHSSRTERKEENKGE
jgi:hypothetical protein